MIIYGKRTNSTVHVPSELVENAHAFDNHLILLNKLIMISFDVIICMSLTSNRCMAYTIIAVLENAFYFKYKHRFDDY